MLWQQLCYGSSSYNMAAAMLWQQLYYRHYSSSSSSSSYALAAVILWQQQQQLSYGSQSFDGSSSYTMAAAAKATETTVWRTLCRVTRLLVSELQNYDLLSKWQKTRQTDNKMMVLWVAYVQLIIILHPWCRKKITQLTLFADTYYKHMCLVVIVISSLFPRQL